MTSTTNIIVFGATGFAGAQVVKHGLECGHHVTAFVRDRRKVTLVHPNLEVVQGDALNQQAVIKHMEGMDAVVSALSAYEGSHRLAFITNIVAGMREHEIARVIVIGGVGALQASEDLKVYETADFPRAYIGLSQAHLAVFDALRASRSDFTFVCPLFITSGARTGVYTVRDRYPAPGSTIRSGDLADFIIKELDENKFVGTKVGISNE